MSAKKTDDTLIDVADAYTKTESFVNRNGKNISLVLLAVVALFAGYILYKQFVVKPKNLEAAQNMWKAEYYFGQDDYQKALDGDSLYIGFIDVANEYGGTPSGKLAEHYAGVSYLNLGDYDTALDYLERNSFDDVMIESTRLGAVGDCYAQLGDLGKAVSFYEKSVSHSANDFTAPIYLKKAGLAYEELGKASQAAEKYQRIKNDFPNSSIGRDIDKYIARATAKSAS